MTDSATLGRKETADILGLSVSQFDRSRPRLEAEGFPKPDPILGRRLRADVDAWLENRRQVRAEKNSAQTRREGIRHDAL